MIKFLDNNELVLGGGDWELTPFRFSKILRFGGGGAEPTWQDVVISGLGSVTLTNAKANGLNYVKLFGGCEQSLLPDTYQLYTSVTADGVTYEYSSQNLTQIPCKRIADNVFGLYNYTTKVFISEV